MLAQRLKELRESETIKEIQEKSEKAKELLEKMNEDYEPCLDLFFKIFQKLNPRKKVLDIDLYPSSSYHIVLHQFGFFKLYDAFNRAEPVKKADLLKFLLENKDETFEKISDEISYKHMRVAFREYCKSVSKFLKSRNVDNISMPKKDFKVVVPCKREIMNTQGVVSVMKNLTVMNDKYGEIKVIHPFDGMNLNSVTENDSLIIVEQIQKEILKGLDKFIEKMETEKQNVGSLVLMKLLQDKFSNFIIADSL